MLSTNFEKVICRLCNEKTFMKDIVNIGIELEEEEDETLIICNKCYSDGRCVECNKEIDDKNELFYLIDKLKCIDTCVICLLDDGKLNHCKCCKYKNKNINIKSFEEYKELEKNNLILKSQIDKLKLELNKVLNDNISNKKIKDKPENSNCINNNVISSVDSIKKKKEKKNNILKNNDIIINRPEKVTLNNCLHNKFKLEYDVKMEILKINAKNKLKKACKKINICKKFINQLNIKKSYNISLRNLFNKITKNIDNKVEIKINDPKTKIEKLFSDNINYKYKETESQSKLGELFIINNINNKKDLKNHIKVNDNFYLNSLINNEDRISRYIKFSKRLHILNKYLNIDIIIYCKFLNDIRDISEEMFSKLTNLLEKNNKNNKK